MGTLPEFGLMGEIEASVIGEMVPSKVPLGMKIGAGVKLAS